VTRMFIAVSILWVRTTRRIDPPRCDTPLGCSDGS
jgi:hypothetical protein